MPAVINIKPTRRLASAVEYASAHGGKDKAHNNYKMKRVLCASGVNCTPENGLKEMMKLVNRKQFIQDLKPQKGKKIVQGYTLIQSFDKSFDYQNPDDVQKVNELGQKLVEKVVKNRMALVYTQADGTHHMLHNHIIVCSLASNLKAMRAKQTRFKTWAKANDEVLQEAGLETLAPVSSKGKTTAKEKLTRAEIAEMDKLSQNKDIKGNPAPKRTRMEEIKEKIEEIEQDPSVTDWDSFVEVAKKHNLDVHVRRNKKKMINGLSYRLLDPKIGMKRGIRAKRLGSNYMKEALYDVFETNGKRRQLAKQREERISARSPEIAEATETSDLGAVQAANFQFALSEQNRVENKSSISTARTRSIGRTVNSEFRQGLTRSNQRSQKDNQLNLFEFTKKFGNNERKHRKFDEALRQFVDYRRKLDTIRQEQRKQQQQLSDFFVLSRIRLNQELARSAGYKSKDTRRIEKQPTVKLVTKFGYTLKREYSDYADMLTNQDYADMQYILHPEWFVKPEQQNPETPTQTTQKQQNQNIDDDDGWNL